MNEFKKKSTGMLTTVRIFKRAHHVEVEQSTNCTRVKSVYGRTCSHHVTFRDGRGGGEFDDVAQHVKRELARGAVVTIARGQWID